MGLTSSKRSLLEAATLPEPGRAQAIELIASALNLTHTLRHSPADPSDVVAGHLVGADREFVGEIGPAPHGEAGTVPADLHRAPTTEVCRYHQRGVVGGPLQHLAT